MFPNFHCFPLPLRERRVSALAIYYNSGACVDLRLQDSEAHCSPRLSGHPGESPLMTGFTHHPRCIPGCRLTGRGPRRCPAGSAQRGSPAPVLAHADLAIDLLHAIHLRGHFLDGVHNARVRGHSGDRRPLHPRPRGCWPSWSAGPWSAPPRRSC